MHLEEQGQEWALDNLVFMGGGGGKESQRDKEWSVG